jgi:hypothetical protein
MSGAYDEGDIYFADESLSVVEQWMQSNSNSSDGQTKTVATKPAPHRDSVFDPHAVGSKVGLGGSLKRPRTAVGGSSDDALEARLLKDKKRSNRKQQSGDTTEFDFHGIIEDDLEESRSHMSKPLQQNKKSNILGTGTKTSTPASLSATNKEITSNVKIISPPNVNKESTANVKPTVEYSKTAGTSRSQTQEDKGAFDPHGGDDDQGIDCALCFALTVIDIVSGGKRLRRRKKTRSKQKNIRKDNRSVADKPEHLRMGSKDFAGRILTDETKAVLGMT